MLETSPNALLGFDEGQVRQPTAEALGQRLVVAAEVMDLSSLLTATEVVEAIAHRAPGSRKQSDLPKD